jgi:hypothetical protein
MKILFDNVLPDEHIDSYPKCKNIEDVDSIISEGGKIFINKNGKHVGCIRFIEEDHLTGLPMWSIEDFSYTRFRCERFTHMEIK